MHDQIDRPGWACVLHQPPTGREWQPADDGHCTCWACADRLRQLLGDIRWRYLHLSSTPLPHPYDGTPRPPGFGSRSPGCDHIIAMTDPRSSAQAHVWVGSDGRVHRESEHPPLSVYSVLDTWATDIAERRGYPRRTHDSVFDVCVWLAAQLDWITRQADVVDFHTDLHLLDRQLKPVTGARSIPIGRCTTCRTRLHASPQDNTVTCNTCITTWTYKNWIKLGESLMASTG